MLPEHGWFDDGSNGSEHSDNARRGLLCKWFRGNLSILGWCNTHLCSYIIGDDSSGGYADARFSLSAWWVNWLLPICGSLDRLHCDYNINGVVHRACCYCAEYRVYADARFVLFDGRGG